MPPLHVWRRTLVSLCFGLAPLFSRAQDSGSLLPPTTGAAVIEVPAGQEGMHRELIPKNITIERCYYTEDVVNPGTTFLFDINGTGFNAQFYRMISVDPDALDVTVQQLKLVTANQIRGLISVGEAATTQYIYPKMYIRGLPVFRAPEPFGVVRPGEVLDIELTSIDESGQFGKFRVLTNLSAEQYARFKILPTSSRLEVSGLKAELPFYVTGTVEIAPGLKSGQYGVIAQLNGREIFRKDPLVDVVKPNVGKTGSVEDIQAQEVAHRPGDVVALSMTGSGFLPGQAAALALKVPRLETPPATFTYLSAGKYDVTVTLPADAPAGAYGVVVTHKGTTVFTKKVVFGVVPPNWIGRVRLAGPLTPGGKAQLVIEGRDFDPAFMQSLQLATDDAGLVVSPLRFQDPRTLAADVTATGTLARGDYIVHVYRNGKELKIPRGNIITLGP